MTTQTNAQPSLGPAGAVANDEFVRGGFARLAHFHSPIWARQKEELERVSAAFTASAWRDGTHGYFWPLDPLHWWSRVWEYPFFAAHLSKLVVDDAKRSRLLDIGAAVTFFTPYLLSKRFEVLSMDYDATMPAHFARVYAAVAPAMGLPPGLPPYLVADARDTRLPEASFDVVTSVSVLEHIPQWERALGEMTRVLRPGGHLVLTLDVKLTDTSSGFTLVELSRLLDQLSADLEPITQQDRRVPGDVLDMNNSPVASYRQPAPRRGMADLLWPPSALPGRAWRVVNRFLRPPTAKPPENLCVFGGVWRKR
jgi:SAM-dependent methyltransferase